MAVGISTRPRLEGLDAARALAVMGMLMVHVGPQRYDTLAQTLYNAPHGRASILFVLLAGTGVALLSRRAGSAAMARLRLVWMALVFLPLGLVLQRMDHGIAVILHHYAAFYLLGIALMRVRPSRLLAISGMLAVVGPVAYWVLRAHWPELIGRDAVRAGDGFGEIFAGLLVTGPYPLLTWSAPVALGVWVGRLDLARADVQRWLLLGGILLTVMAGGAAYLTGLFWGEADIDDWQRLFGGAPHSQMPLWLIGAMGSAVAVVGLMLISVRRWPHFFAPLTALGQLALSFYVAHLFLLHAWTDLVRRESIGEAVVSVLVVSAMAMAFALWWRRHFARGPLEAVLAWPFQPALRDPSGAHAHPER